MQSESGQSSPEIPAALLQPTPRNVRLNVKGVAVVVVAFVLLVGGLWVESGLYRRARRSHAILTLFEFERLVTGAQVIAVEERGRGDNRRSRIRYRYAVKGQEYSGSAVHTGDLDGYRAGSPIAVWYLPSEPGESWIDGDVPHLESSRPAYAVFGACGAVALCLIFMVKRQSALLTYGRPALAVIRTVEKRRSDKGTHWRVHYEWTLLSGATRTGRYTDNRKQPPPVGSVIPIVYDRDQPQRNNRYPMSFVSVR